MHESWKLRWQVVSCRCGTKTSVWLLVTMRRVLGARFGSFASLNRHGMDAWVRARAVRPAPYTIKERQ